MNGHSCAQLSTECFELRLQAYEREATHTLWPRSQLKSFRFDNLPKPGHSGSQKYVPTFEPTLHQDFQLWLCWEVVGHTQGLQSWDTHLARAPTLGWWDGWCAPGQGLDCSRSVQKNTASNTAGWFGAAACLALNVVAFGCHLRRSENSSAFGNLPLAAYDGAKLRHSSFPQLWAVLSSNRHTQGLPALKIGRGWTPACLSRSWHNFGRVWCPFYPLFLGDDWRRALYAALVDERATAGFQKVLLTLKAWCAHLPEAAPATLSSSCCWPRLLAKPQISS